MAWRRGDAITPERLRADMHRVRADQQAARQQWAEAIEGERRALEAAESFRAVQARCERIDQECTAALGMLQDEIDELIPRQRKP